MNEASAKMEEELKAKNSKLEDEAKQLKALLE